MPILFPLSNHNLGRQKNKGFGPMLANLPVNPAQYLHVFGVTKDSAGSPLASCTVKLYRTRDDVMVDTITSDASGNYDFRGVSSAETYYIVAYNTSGPVAGTTVNTLLAA